MRKALWHKGTK